LAELAQESRAFEFSFGSLISFQFNRSLLARNNRKTAESILFLHLRSLPRMSIASVLCLESSLIHLASRFARGGAFSCAAGFNLHSGTERKGLRFFLHRAQLEGIALSSRLLQRCVAELAVSQSSIARPRERG
jgi:hypothetical protein